jgi:Icc protein
LRLLPNGQIETGVERVTGFDYTVDYGSSGY